MFSNPDSVRYPVHRGVSLRDAFALAVAPTLVDQFEIFKYFGSKYEADNLGRVAEGAYKIADAMLKARGGYSNEGE